MKLPRTTAASLAAAAALALPITASAAPVKDAVSAQDKVFLVAAHQSNLAEIAAGEAAQHQATTAAVRQHGATFIRDHTKLDASLTKVADSLGVDLPGSPSRAQQSVLDSVAAKSGAAFDAAWVSTQITGHKQAKAAGAKEISSGSNDSVIGLAKTAAPVIASHLAMLESTVAGGTVHAGLGGSDPGPGALPWVLVVGGAAVAGAGAAGLRRRRRAAAS